MLYVYVIRSRAHPKRYYIGFTENIDQRVKEHNEGKSLHTAKYGQWELAFLSGSAIQTQSSRSRALPQVRLRTGISAASHSLKSSSTFLSLMRLGWRASRSCGGSRAKAGGEGSRTPVSCLPCPARSTDALLEPVQRQRRFNEQAWTLADVISIVITVASVWKHPKSQYWTACFRDQNGKQRRISTKETNNKKALKIAEEFERAAKTKRTLKQVQNVLDRLHEEVSGQRVVRTTFREYLSDWLMAKKAETASSTMNFYQISLRKFVQFLG
jgi:hypothetical protein